MNKLCLRIQDTLAVDGARALQDDPAAQAHLAECAECFAVLEGLYRVLGLSGEPPMTRFVAAQLASSHSYDMEPARRDFGYYERVSMAEATDRLVAHYRGNAVPATS